MAQSAMTVRLDSKMKAQFDKLCSQFGMSANTAINVFVNAVVRSKSIPFSINATESHSTRENALRAFELLRQQATSGKEWTLEEINAEISKARQSKK